MSNYFDVNPKVCQTQQSINYLIIYHRIGSEMNSKSFIFGKNYDSDYLTAKRFKRKSYDQKYDKNFRRRRRFDTKVDNQSLNPIENTRKHLAKNFDNRLTLKTKPVDYSTDDYHKNTGIYANGKSSDAILNKNWVLNDKKQFKARINEDLFWILRQKNQNKGQHMTQTFGQKRVAVEKETQINSTIDLDDSSGDESEGVPKEGRLKYKPLRRSKDSLLSRNAIRHPNKREERDANKINNQLNSFESKPLSQRSDVLSGKSMPTPMPSLPTSLKIVKNLMNCYENERNILNQNISEFGTDLVVERCRHLRQISKSCDQLIEQNLIETQNYPKVGKQTIDLSPKPSKQSKGVMTEHKNQESSHHMSVVPYDQNVLEQLEPRVGNMLSRILLNISEGIPSFH